MLACRRPRAASVALALALASTSCVAPMPTPADPTPDRAAPREQGGEPSRHEGYYYPRLTSTETYAARARALDDSNRQRRLLFVSALAAEQAELPYPPTFIMFAKGDEAEKLIILGMRDGAMDTLYRARALLANFTYAARQTPIFQENGVDDFFTFFDLLKLLGFAQVTVSDGRVWAHRINLD